MPELFFEGFARATAGVCDVTQVTFLIKEVLKEKQNQEDEGAFHSQFDMGM